MPPDFLGPITGTDLVGNSLLVGEPPIGTPDENGFVEQQKFNVNRTLSATAPNKGGNTPLASGSNRFVNNPLSQNFNYIHGPKRTGQAETNNVGLPLILKENPSRSDLTKTPESQFGVPSFINPYAVLTMPTKYGSDNSPFASLIDDPTSPTKFSSPTYVVGRNGLQNVEPTVYNLVNTPPDGSNSDIPVLGAKMPYRYTDFLYCKYYGRIANNYLITLRRYPAPTFDNLGIPLTSEDGFSTSKQYDFKPIAQAVTWLGEETENKLSEIMGFDVILNWKQYESQVETYNGNEQDASAGPSMFQGAAKFLAILNGTLGGNMNSPYDQQNYNYDPYANGPYSHRVYGPVNVIAKTYKRDRGLDFKQTFNINFHYSLKSISGINPKAAMLDIMNNMLQLTYNNAAFWGGANRYFAQKPIYPFLGGKGGMNAWYRGDPLGFLTNVRQSLMGSDGTLSLIGKFFDDLSQDPISALKKLVTGGISVGMKIIGQGRAPDIVGMKALLTGEPVGEWHMVVGNPYSPTLMIGNLICTGAKFKFNDVIGADNFPTELKVTITLEHGRPRDMGDIASMFNEGEGRMYFAPMGNEEAFRSSAQFNSKNDNSWTKAQRTAATNKQVEIPNSLSKNIEVKQKNQSWASNNNATKIQFGSKNTGDARRFDDIVSIITSTTTQAGHDLAIKMGLASAMERGSSTSKLRSDYKAPVEKTNNAAGNATGNQ